MTELEPIFSVVERLGTWVIFLYLYLREISLRQLAQDRHITDMRDLTLRMVEKTGYISTNPPTP